MDSGSGLRFERIDPSGRSFMEKNSEESSEEEFIPETPVESGQIVPTLRLNLIVVLPIILLESYCSLMHLLCYFYFCYIYLVHIIIYFSHYLVWLIGSANVHPNLTLLTSLGIPFLLP